MREEPANAKPQPGSGKPDRREREERLAAALRANLGRRRAQKQARAEDPATDEQDE